jgi:hypothetical protein
MRRHERNAAAEPIIQALMAGMVVEENDARDMIRYLLHSERDGFGKRILRRLSEARYYHGRVQPGMDELLSSGRVTAIIKEEVGE